MYGSPNPAVLFNKDQNSLISLIFCTHSADAWFMSLSSDFQTEKERENKIKSNVLESMGSWFMSRGNKAGSEG